MEKEEGAGNSDECLLFGMNELLLGHRPQPFLILIFAFEPNTSKVICTNIYI